MKRILQILLLLLVIAAVWLVYALNNRPDLGAYAELWLPPAETQPGPLRITNLGVSSLLISDGVTSFMTDGFFSRPGLLKTALTTIAPDPARIDQGLERAGAGQLMAVVVLHSHYDHAMDAPQVAQQSGALLIGSASTANIGRGAGLPENRILTVQGGEVMRFGRFTISVIRSRHFPHGQAMGEITEPLTPPARATAYQEGGSYSLLVEHPQGSLLIQGSAGFEAGALQGRQADVVLLGVGLLGSKGEDYMQAYWAETVQAVQAQRVIPIHWDDFFKPLAEQPQPFPYLLDDFAASMRFIQARAAQDNVDVRLAPAWRAVNPFAGL